MATKDLPACAFPQDHTTLIMRGDQETQPPLLAQPGKQNIKDLKGLPELYLCYLS